MSTNGAGWHPVEYNILVLVEEAPGKVGSILLPDDERQRQQYASTEAIIIEVSPLAFNFDDQWPNDTKPKAGDRVLIAKYGGTALKRPGEPGPDYRICKDKDILAVKA